MTPKPGTNWSRRWWGTRCGCWITWTSRYYRRTRARWWPCWRWSRGRTWNRRRARTARTGGGGSHGRWPGRPGDLHGGPETRHAHKTIHQRRNGFKAHVVVEPVTGLVTATRVTKASGAESADATVGVKLLATDTTAEDNPSAMMRRAPRSGGGARGLGVRHRGGTGRAGQGGAHRDHQAGRCARRSSGRVHPRGLHGGRDGRDRDLPERADRRSVPSGRSRSVPGVSVSAARTLHHRRPGPQAGSASARFVAARPRARATDPAFQETYRSLRPMVERSIAWLTRGNRKALPRGGQERRVVREPGRGGQPDTTPDPRIGPLKRDLGAGSDSEPTGSEPQQGARQPDGTAQHDARRGYGPDPVPRGPDYQPDPTRQPEARLFSSL